MDAAEKMKPARERYGLLQLCADGVGNEQRFAKKLSDRSDLEGLPPQKVAGVDELLSIFAGRS